MKRLIILLCGALLWLSAAAEVPAPPKPVDNPEAIAEAALPLMTLLCACPSFSSFEGTPSDALAREVREKLPCFVEDGWSEEALSAIFREDFAFPSETMPSTAPFILTELTIDTAFDTGAGTVCACVIAKQDLGAGMEFSFAAEFTLRADPDAFFGARVERVFIPE